MSIYTFFAREFAITMPNSQTHALIGGIGGAIAYLWFKKQKTEQPTLQGLFASGAVGALSAVLPDVLEPATNPNHRELFHSLSISAAVTAGAKGVVETSTLTDAQKIVALSASAGYLSHIVLDAFTPKCVPVL